MDSAISTHTGINSDFEKLDARPVSETASITCGWANRLFRSTTTD